MKKQIFIFSECYYPDLLSTGYYITEIAESLAKNYSVNVITLSHADKKNNENKNDVKIYRIKNPKIDKNKILNRIFRFFLISFSFYDLGKKILKKNHEVICVTNPAFFILFISFLQKRIGFNLNIIVHDVFPESLLPSKILSSFNPLYKVLLFLFNKAYKRANNIIVCGRDMKELFLKKIPNFNNKIKFIPNWSDDKNIKPNLKLRDEKLSLYNIEKKFVFQFAGNLGRLQGIKKLLKSIELINDNKCKFLFFGDGVLLSYLKKNKPENCIYGGNFKKNKSNLFLNACDISIVSLTKNMLGIGVPSKTYNILAAGKPILYIGDENSEIAKMVIENKIGFVSKPLIRNIVKGIKWFCSLKRKDLEKMEKKSRYIAEKYYSKSNIISKYNNIFK